jgi:hypothetical protein
MVKSQIKSQVQDQVWIQVESQIWHQVKHQVWDLIARQVWYQADLQAPVVNQVPNQVTLQLEADIRRWYAV